MKKKTELSTSTKELIRKRENLKMRIALGASNDTARLEKLEGELRRRGKL